MPAYTMNGRNYMPQDSTQKPGPGQHSPEKVGLYKPKLKHGKYGAKLRAASEFIRGLAFMALPPQRLLIIGVFGMGRIRWAKWVQVQKKRPMDLSSFAPALTFLSRFLQRTPHETSAEGRVFIPPASLSTSFSWLRRSGVWPRREPGSQAWVVLKTGSGWYR